MSNPSKDLGTRGETRVKRDLAKHGFKVWRRSLAGSKDEGDLGMIMPDGTEVTLEVKAGKQTIGYCRALVEKWKKQTLDEAQHSGCPAVLIILRYKKQLRNAEVWMPNGQWGYGLGGDTWTLMYYDEFLLKMGGTDAT